MAGCDAMVSSPWCTDGSTGVHHFNRYLVIRVHICRLGSLAISPIILCVQEGVESVYCEAKTMQQWPGGWWVGVWRHVASLSSPPTSILHHDWYSECFLICLLIIHFCLKMENSTRCVSMCASLVPRRGGGGERAPGTHCLRMRVIIGRSTW